MEGWVRVNSVERGENASDRRNRGSKFPWQKERNLFEDLKEGWVSQSRWC